MLLNRRIAELIEESGESIQAIAESGKISRTTLQKVKSGERKPTYEFLNKLIRALRLSDIEELQLKEMYEISEKGEKNYQNRKLVKELIELISELTEYQLPFKKDVSINEAELKMNIDEKEEISISGREKVILEIQKIIDREICLAEAPGFKMVTTSKMDFLYHYIFEEILGNTKKIVIEDVICFEEEAAVNQEDAGLLALKFLIGLTLMENVSYSSNYCNIRRPQNSSAAAVFIVTSQEVIIISADLNKAVLYRNQEKIGYYQDQFEKFLLKSQSFIVENNNPLMIYGFIDNQNYQPLMVLEPIPCFAFYFTDKLLEEKIKNDFPYCDVLLTVAKQFYQNFKVNGQQMNNVFSFHYLSQFMEDGCLYLPEEIAKIMTPPERLYLLKRVRDDLFNGKRNFWMVNEKKFFMNSSSEYTDEEKEIQIVLHYRREEKLIFKSVSINRKSILKSFKDFFNYLPGSELLLSKDQTLKALDSLIEKYVEIPEYQSFSELDLFE